MYAESMQGLVEKTVIDSSSAVLKDWQAWDVHAWCYSQRVVLRLQPREISGNVDRTTRVRVITRRTRIVFSSSTRLVEKKKKKSSGD